MASPRVQRTVLVAVLLALGAGYFYKLERGDFKDWDESLYAVRALAIVREGGSAWIDQKPWSLHGWWTDGVGHSGYYSASFPPLLPWLSAVSFHLFGVSEWSHRAPVALVAASALFALFLLVRPWGGSIAALGAVAALLDVIFYTHYARRGQFDVLFISFLLWSLAAYQAALLASTTRRRRWLLVGAGVALGLSAMSKIALGVVFFVGLVAPLLVGRLVSTPARWRLVVEEVAIVGGVALAIWLPWHVAMTIVGGREFWSWYVGFHLLSRATSVLDFHDHPWWLYLRMTYDHVPASVVALVFVAVLLAAGTIARAAWCRVAAIASRRAPLGDPAASPPPLPPRPPFALAPALALWGMLFPLLLVTSATTKRDTYFLVVVPFLAVAAGVVLGALWIGAVRPVPLVGIVAFALVGVIWQRSAGEQKDLQFLLENIGTKFTVDDLWPLLGHILPPIVAGGCGAAVALALICAALATGLRRRWPCSPWRWNTLLGRLAVILLVAFVLNSALTKTYSADRGRRFYGWQGIRPLVHAQRHDDLLLVGWHDGPAKGFYLLGAFWADRPLHRASQAKNWEEVVQRLDAGDTERLLVVVDRGTCSRELADGVSTLVRSRGWRFLGHSGRLFVYAPPALQYGFEELGGLTRRVRGSALRAHDEREPDEEDEAVGAAHGD